MFNKLNKKLKKDDSNIEIKCTTSKIVETKKEKVKDNNYKQTKIGFNISSRVEECGDCFFYNSLHYQCDMFVMNSISPSSIACEAFSKL